MTNYDPQEIADVMAARNLNRSGAIQFIRRRRSKGQTVLLTNTTAPVTPAETPAAPAESNAHKAVEELETLPPAQSIAPTVDAKAAAKAAKLQERQAAKEAKATARATAKAEKLQAKETAAKAKQEAKDAKKKAREEAKAAKAAAAPASTRRPRNTGFDTAKAVNLYANGVKVVDIAVALGYVKGQGQNRVRAALKAAGVYVERPAKPVDAPAPAAA